MLSKLSSNLKPSPTVSLDSRVKTMQSEGIKVINLGVGEPDFDTPAHIQQSCIKAMSDGFTHYSQASGLLDFRIAIQKKFYEDNKIEYDLSEIIVGLGSKILLYLAYRTLLDHGDEVLIPIPAWNTFAEQVNICGGKPAFIKLESPFKLTAALVKKHITKKTKILLLNSPSNPTGAMIDRSELNKIADLSVEHNFYIISDEIYEKLVYRGSHISIASINSEVKTRTITINGLSKAYAMTGWRVGFAGGPREIITSMINLQTQIASSAATFSQVAGTKALMGTQLPLKKMYKEFVLRRDFLLKNLGSIPGISIVEPEGAFYVFVSIEKILNNKYKTSSEWCEALLEKQKVAVVPGEAFFYPGYFRLSYAASFENIEKGIKGIKNFIES